MNFRDPNGLVRSSADEDNEEGYDDGYVYVGLLQIASAQMRSKYGPVSGDVEKLTQFSIDMRTAAHGAIASMSQGCRNALGKQWNVSNGLDSLLGKTDPANTNAVKFYDGRDAAVAGTSMPAWGLNSTPTTGQFFSQSNAPVAFTSNFGDRASNDIVLGAAYFTGSPAQQSALLIHEVLHAYTGAGDNRSRVEARPWGILAWAGCEPRPL